MQKALLSAMVHLRRGYGFVASAVAALICTVAPATTVLAADASVWFNPAPQSPDYLALFDNPDAWVAARRLVDVFEFSPAQLQPSDRRNSFGALTRVDAFAKLRNGGSRPRLASGP